MEWLFAALIVLALGGVAVLASGRGAGLEYATRDLPGPDLPSGPIGPDDLRRVRFSVAVRGYRMDEVDALLDRLARQFEPEAPAGDGTL